MFPPPSFPPPNGSLPCGVVWLWVASPSLWCGVVVGCFPPPCGVVWFGCGLWCFPPSPLWCGVGWVVPRCVFGFAWGVGKSSSSSLSIHLSVFLVGRRVSSAHVPANDYRFIDCGATIFVTVGAIAIGLQWVNCHRDRACQGTRSS